MSYTYKGKRPIETAEKFLESYMKNCPAKKLPPEGHFTYHHGVFLSGVEKLYLQNNNEKYDRYIREYLSIVLDENKKAKRVEGHFWLSLDSLDFRQAGILLARMYEEDKDERYLDSMAELCESLIDYPKNSKGGFWHMKSQPNQMWLDGLYMVAPLCAKYAVLRGKREFAYITLKQASLMYDNMCDKKNNLLYHGWDDSFEAEWADKTTGLSQEKWGRALGWFTTALADIIEILGVKFIGIEKNVSDLKAVLESIVNYQTENGFWCQVIDKPQEKGNWEETSGTCLIAYSLAKAVRLGLLDEKYLHYAKKAYEAVVNSLVENDLGEVIIQGICSGTCIEEGTYEHYINCKTVENDLHGRGAFLLMCAEMNLL